MRKRLAKSVKKRYNSSSIIIVGDFELFQPAKKEKTVTLEEYLSLRNGTDVRGVASIGPDGEKITLTEEVAKSVARAFCAWLSAKKGGTEVSVAVGYDSRISSPALCSAVVDGIIQAGGNAVVTGLSTTPSMFMLLQDSSFEGKCQGSIMITASHLPSHRNGMKFFTEKSGLESNDIKEILTKAAEPFTPTRHPGKRKDCPYLNKYASDLVKKVRTATGEEKPLRGKRIVVDAGNGAGGFFASQVLQPLGADTTGSQFLNPDGTFPNHIPNPENKAAMRSVCEAVKKVEADFGIIFDTDVDRAGAVDNEGNEINRNRLIALISAILLEEKAGVIVTDSVTSAGLAKFIVAKGGRHHRFKRGYKNVINEAIRLNGEGEYAPLAIETSGHAALMENYFLDDGAYLITRLLIALAKASKEGKNLTDLIADLEMPEKEIEMRLRFVERCDFKTLGASLIEDFIKYVEKLPYATLATDSHEGVRVAFDERHGDGWALLRMSLHEPLMPVNVESNSLYGALQIVKELFRFLKIYPFIDVTPVLDAREECRQELIGSARYNNQRTHLF